MKRFGGEVWQLKVGQRVVLSPHFVATENVEEPAQILIGLTAMGPGSAPLQADWPDGTLALTPVLDGYAGRWTGWHRDGADRVAEPGDRSVWRA